MTQPRHQAGITGNPKAQKEIDDMVAYELRENTRRFKRLMEDDDFRIWFYDQITQRGGLTSPAPKDRGEAAMARFEGRRDWAIEMYNDALSSSPNAWSKVLHAREEANAKRQERMKQIAARAGVPQQPVPEESNDA